MIKVSAPGKLFLSGEWSVLEVGNPGIVTSVNKRVFAEIEESDEISITVDDFGISGVKAGFNGKILEYNTVISDEQKEKLIFMKGAIETVLHYLGESKKFNIRSWGEESSITVDGVQKKVGFGSSAAAVVATVAGILAFNDKDITSRETKDIIYKLSAIAHYFAQGKVGSAFDVAASTYGGVFVYKRFDPSWLMKQFENNVPVKEIAEQEWPSFDVEELDIPEDFRLVIGWTKESASTSAMVKQMNTLKENNPQEYSRLYNQIVNIVKELIQAWKGKNIDAIINLLRKNEDYLRELGKKSGVNIETENLRKLSELANSQGAAGKLSGAVGGDCGIAVCFSEDVLEKVKSSWIENGIYLIDATIDYEGVKSE